jgi:hypothetical protein
MIFTREILSILVVILDNGFVILNQNDVIMNASSFCHFGIHLFNQSVAWRFQNDVSFCPAFCHFEKFAFCFSALFQNDKMTFSHSPYGRERRLTAFSLPTVEGVGAGHVPAPPKSFSVFPSTTDRRCKR